MPSCKLTTCYRYPCFSSITEQERAFDFGRIFQELETPTIQDQLISLYEPVLEQDFKSFLQAVQKATELPDLTEGQRVKLFHYHYKPLKINLLEGVKTEPAKKQIPKGVKWIEI